MTAGRKNKVPTSPSGAASLMADSPRNSRWKRYGAVIVFIFAFSLYANTIPNDYCMDDIFVTAQNELVKQGIRAIPEILTTPYAEVEKVHLGYRPLVKVMFAVEAELFGANPHVSHFIQALFYALCCALLFRLLLKIFPRLPVLFPLTVTLLFAAHPLHTEVAAGLKSRDELLAFFFSMGVIYFFIRGCTENKMQHYAVAFGLYGLALLSKPGSTVLLLWVPLILYYVSQVNLFRKLAFITLGLLIETALILYLVKVWIIQGSLSRALSFTENPLEGHTDYLLHAGTVLNSLWFYFLKMIYPHPLGWYYGYNMIAIEKPWALIPVLSFVLHAVLLLYALSGWRRRTLLSFSILLYLTAIAPYCNLVAPVPGIVGERLAFFASLGYCLSLAWLLMKISGMALSGKERRLKPFFSFLTVTVLLLYSIKVVSRNREWKDNLTLYAADAHYLHKSATALQVYGVELQKAFQQSDNPQRDGWMLEEALKQYRGSLAVYAPNPHTLTRIGEILAAEYNRSAEAMPYYRQALKLNPDFAQVHFDLAYCYELQMNFDSALLRYKTALRLDPAYTGAWQNISVLFSKMGMNDSAIIYNEKLLQLDSLSEHGNANKGFFYKKMGMPDSAKVYFERALKINPERNDVSVALDSCNMHH